MTRRPSKLLALLPAVFAVTLVACEAQKSENPLSPSVAGPIAGVDISAPRLLEPAQGFKFKENQQPIKLVIENSVTTGVRPVSYIFEVATDSDFNTKVFARNGVPQGDGRTSVQIDALELGRPYYWRARAEDGANNSTYSTAGFSLLPRAVFTAPSLATPVHNTQVAERNPTLKVNNSTHNEAVGTVSYFFVVSKDQAFTQVVATGMVPEGGPTMWTVDRDLEYGLSYFWRVRATDGEITTDWSTTAIFKSPTAPAPGPGGGGGGGGGGVGSCGPPHPNNGWAIVECVMAKFPERLVAGVSHGQRVANMEFLRDQVIATGICGGMDLGWNLKRGGPDISVDAITQRHANGVVEIFDIGAAYDDTAIPLRLMWIPTIGPFYKTYSPRPSCQ